MINVSIKDKPEITRMLESDLEKVLKVTDNENELTNVIEYYLNDELVHRSVHVQLKKQIGIESALTQI